MKNNTQTLPNGPLRLVIFSSKTYKSWALGAIVAVLVASVASSLIPYVYKFLIDNLGSGKTGVGGLWFWAWVYVALAVSTSFTWRLSGYFGSYWATGVRQTAREFLSDYVINHSHNYFSNRFAGALNNKLSQASNGASDMVQAFLWQWLSFAIELAVSFYLVATSNKEMAWVFLAWIVVVTPVNLFLYKKKMVLGKEASKSDTDLNANTIDALSNISAVRDYARIPFELSRINGFIKRRRDAGIKNWRFGEIAVTINHVFEAIFAGGMTLGTVYYYVAGSLSAGDVVMIITLISYVRRSISSLGQQFNVFADNASTIREALSEVFQEHEIVDVKGAKHLGIKEGAIEFKNVSFGYGTREIFKELSLTIKPGERVGLIGKSGAGKSTLVRLLTRQHDLSSGEIAIDGQDVAKVTQESLREAIAVVPQEPLLFHRSIKENIQYGNLDATEEDLVAAAKQAQAHDFISAASDGYNTLVGERGIKLSGGEKQRVAIARAFLKKAKILLLDEATSALDSESEILIQEALSKLMEGKTVIAIAHRLSTLRAMDRLIVMDGGKIVEDGTHEELVNKGGIYADLWAHQAGGFIKED